MASSVLSKGKSAMPPHSMVWWRCGLYLIKQNCLLKTFIKTLILMTWVSLSVFPSRTNLKLHNISPKFVKKVIMNLDLTKTFSPDFIPVVVLKKCEAELSYILAKLFNKCLRSLAFQIVGNFHQ